MTKLEQAVETAVAATIESLGCELVEVKHNRQYGENHLIIYIDSNTGISLDTCEMISSAVDPILDTIPELEQAYYLDVSSAGLDRPIKTDRDYQRNIGREVEVKFYVPLNGKKTMEGILLGRESNLVKIETFDGKTVDLEAEKIALMTQLIRF